MALGDNYNGNDNNKKKYYEPILYSPYGTSNTDGVDPSALSYSFFNGLLKISIAPMKPGAQPGDRQLWDHDNAVSVWLTHVKARMLHDEIIEILNNPDSMNNAGVTTGNEGLISFSNGKELGAANPCLIIRKVDQNTGEVTSTYAYEFKTKHYWSVRNFDPADPKAYDSKTFGNLEIEELITILEQYYTSISGAAPYANVYAQRFDQNRMNTKISLIMDKLGIEQSAEYSKGNGGRGNQSFFNSNGMGNTNSANTGMRSSTIDQLGEEME